MLLCWEIDYPFWAEHAPVLSYKHFPSLNFAAFAGYAISFKIVGELLLEHQGNAFTHYANGVDGVYDRLYVGFEQVSFTELDHLMDTIASASRWVGLSLPLDIVILP